MDNDGDGELTVMKTMTNRQLGSVVTGWRQRWRPAIKMQASVKMAD